MELAAAYIRVSVDKDEEKVSPMQQLNDINKFIEKNGWTPVNSEGYIDLNQSGKTLNRPSFNQLLKDVDEFDIKHICVYDTSRLSRSLRDSLNINHELLQKGVKIHEVVTEQVVNLDEWNDNSLIHIFKGIMNQNAREETRKKVIANMNHLVDLGLYVGGVIPFGYQVVEVEVHGKKRKKFEIEENYEKQEMIKNIFKWYTEDHKSMYEITNLINDNYLHLLDREQAVKYSKKEKDNLLYDRKFVYRVLKNPTYTGYMSKGRRQILTNKKKDLPREDWYWSLAFRDGKEPDFTPMVSFKTWEKAQELLESKNPSNNDYIPSRENSPYLLSGLLKCASCQRAMNGATSKSKPRADGTRSVRYYYKCDTPRKNKGICDNKKMVRCEKIDSDILRIFGNTGVILNCIKTIHEYQKESLESDTEHLRKLTSIDIAIDKLEKQKKNLYDFVADEEDSAVKKDLISEAKERVKKIESLKKEKEEITQQREENEMKKVDLNEVVYLLLNQEEFYNKKNVKVVRNYLNQVIDNVYYAPNKTISVVLKFNKQKVAIDIVQSEQLEKIKEEVKTEKGNISKKAVKDHSQEILLNLLAELWGKPEDQLEKDDKKILEFIIEVLEKYNEELKGDEQGDDVHSHHPTRGTMWDNTTTLFKILEDTNDYITLVITMTLSDWE